jgi:MFS family permease
MGVLMFTIDTSAVNIVLPTLVQTLHTTFATIQWVVLSYLLVITALVLGAARLGDMFGKKRLYLGGLVVFTISSMLCGLAPGVYSLIALVANWDSWLAHDLLDKFTHWYLCDVYRPAFCTLLGRQWYKTTV